MARRKSKDSSFQGTKMSYRSIQEAKDAVHKNEGFSEDRGYAHAKTWKNRRPICPYGCGEEGTLLEVVMQDGKALGIYTHSGSVKPFTADLQMSPKPTGRKLVIGADGEPHLVSDEDILT